MTEEAKFTEWLEKEKAKGLKDMSFFPNPSWKPKDKEEIFRALNEINAAIENQEPVRRGDVF